MPDQEELNTKWRFCVEWTMGAGLTLHPTKTRIVNATAEGFDFLLALRWLFLKPAKEEPSETAGEIM